MLITRVIPCLLLKGTGLVKTTRFKNPKYVGDPINTVRIFNEKEVDELLFLDIEATNSEKDPNYELLTEIANECFMPLAYGGGIRTLEQAKRIFNIGVEKVAINSAAHTNKNLIREIAAIFGSQAVIGVIDVKKNLWGKYKVVSNSTRKTHKLSPVEWARELEDMGVGEILLTSVDREGTWSGFDLELTALVSTSVKVPVIAHGGAGSIEHLLSAIKYGKASALAIGSMVVYQKNGFGILVNFPEKAQLELLQSKRSS